MPNPPAFECRFEFTPDNSTVVITLTGQMDPSAVQELFPQIQEVFRAGVRRFVFDLSGLEYSGSLGLRLILGLQNQVKPDGKVAVCSPNDSVRSMPPNGSSIKRSDAHTCRMRSVPSSR